MIPKKDDILTIHFTDNVFLRGIVDRCTKHNGVSFEDFYRVTFSKILDGEKWKKHFNRKQFCKEYTFYDDNYEVVCPKLLKTKIGGLIYG